MTDQNRILRLRSVLERTGLSRSTLYRKLQTGKGHDLNYGSPCHKPGSHYEVSWIAQRR